MPVHKAKTGYVGIAERILPARHTVCDVALNGVQRLSADFLYNAYMIAAAEENDVISLQRVRASAFISALLLKPGHTGWHIGKLRYNGSFYTCLICAPADKHGAPRSLCPIPFAVFGVTL